MNYRAETLFRPVSTRTFPRQLQPGRKPVDADILSRPWCIGPANAWTIHPAAGGNLSVAGIGENKTIACNDSVVSVSGVSNTIVITGHCASLTVSGAKNVVAADTISSSGFNNEVTYHSGSPSVDTSGESNSVQQG
jgi:Protein of unknown function (DUF3060)